MNSLPPSSRLPNLRNAAGLGAAAATTVLADATLASLRQRGIRILGPLGKPGGYGMVFAASDAQQRQLAVKVLKDPLHRESRKRHNMEARVLSSGTIPADLVPFCLYAHKTDVPPGDQPITDMADGVQPYLVMSRIPGKEVHEYVGGERPLSMSERIELVERSFEALERLHESGIAHGDPSPRNVLVEKGNILRFVDLGAVRGIQRVVAPMMSTMAAGCGTPDYAPLEQLTGELRTGVWTDIRAMFAVAFDTLTGQRHDNALPVDEKRKRLQDAGVPPGIIRIVLKGLRVPDLKRETDPRVFNAAREVLDAIRGWRRWQERRRQALVMSPVLLAFLLLSGWQWTRLQAEAADRQWQEVRVLRDQMGPLSDKEATRVRQLVETADQEIRTLEAERSQTNGFQRQQRLSGLADSLRLALDTRRHLEKLLPRYTTLGEMLNKLSWQPDARGLTERREALLRDWMAIKKLLDDGDPSAAAPRLEQFAGRLIADWEANERARTAATTRADWQRLLASVPERLRSTARHGELKADGEQAEEQWNKADDVPAFALADTSFASVRQRLNDWLDTEESEAEKAARVKGRAEEVARLGEQLLAAQTRASALATEIDGYKTQIAQQTRINQEDRLERQKSESQAAKLTAERANLQTQLRAASDGRAAAESQTAEKDRALTRLGKEKADIESALTVAQSALNTAQSQLATERGRTTELASVADQFKAAADKAITDAKAAETQRQEAARRQANVPRIAVTPVGPVGGSVGGPVGVAVGTTTYTQVQPGRQAGDRLLLTIQGNEVPWRWCPPGTYQMGSPPNEAGRYSDEDAVT
ncbi:MAG: protein kinase domain-containing protein, partial [Planctomycetota bacterium]